MAKKKASKKKVVKKVDVDQQVDPGTAVQEPVEDIRYDGLLQISEALDQFDCGNLGRFKKRIENHAKAIGDTAEAMQKAILVDVDRQKKESAQRQAWQDRIDASNQKGQN